MDCIAKTRTYYSLLWYNKNTGRFKIIDYFYFPQFFKFFGYTEVTLCKNVKLKKLISLLFGLINYHVLAMLMNSLVLLLTPFSAAIPKTSSRLFYILTHTVYKKHLTKFSSKLAFKLLDDSKQIICLSMCGPLEFFVNIVIINFLTCFT